MKGTISAAVFAMACCGAILGVAHAQSAAPAPEPMRDFMSAADVQGLIAKAKANVRPDQANYSQRILSSAPHRVNLEYRPIAGGASVHPTNEEMFFVVEGAGTLVTGGTLVPAGGANTIATISNGKARAVAKGDFLIVAKNTPHQFTEVKGGPLVLMSFHLQPN